MGRILALVIAVIATNLLTFAAVYYVNRPIGDEKDVYCPAYWMGFVTTFYPAPLTKPRVLDCHPADRGLLLCEPAAGQ